MLVALLCSAAVIQLANVIMLIALVCSIRQTPSELTAAEVPPATPETTGYTLPTYIGPPRLYQPIE